MSEPVYPADSLIRERAIDTSGSFVVSAPAGSGKTGLLSLRVLKLLGEVTKPEEILCITFTRKAAHEMRERIFSALKKAGVRRNQHVSLEQLNDYEKTFFSAADRALANDEKHGWNLLEQTYRIKITTIDGFCKQLCSQLPFFSGLMNDTGVIEQVEYDYQQAINVWLETSLTSEKRQNIAQLIGHFSGDALRLSRMLARLLSAREQWLPMIMQTKHYPELARQHFESTMNNWANDTINQCLRYLLPYETEFTDVFAYAHKHVGEGKQAENLAVLSEYKLFPTPDNEKSVYWRCFANYCLTAKEGNFRKVIDKNMGFAPVKGKGPEAQQLKQRKQALLEIFSHLTEAGFPLEVFASLRDLPESKYDENQWMILQSLIEILPDVVAHLKLRFNELGQVDFTEYGLAANAALSLTNGDMDLQQRLDYRIQHILVDEFQDTSQTQLELLTELTREWVPGDGRTLFVVGDGMQSCYSFRNANVGIFLNLQKYGLNQIDLNNLQLCVNFRSSSTIVTWVNDVFRHSFPTTDDARLGAVSYTSSVSAKPIIVNDSTSEDSYVKTYAFDLASSNSSEAQFIAQEIQALRQQAPDESIAILAKNRAHLNEIIAELTHWEIPFQAVEIDQLRSKQHIKDLEILCRLLSNPSDRIAWLAFLRSPWCALNHVELFQFFHLSNENDHLTNNYENHLKTFIGNLDKSETKTRLIKSTNSLFHAFQSRQQRPFAEVIEILWLSLGGQLTLTNEAAEDDVETFLKLVSKYEKNNLIELWDKFELALNKLYAAPATDAGTAVQIMTMHKSKGLEFDSVFLPALHRPRRSADPEALYWIESTDAKQHREFILSPIAAKVNKDGDSLSEFIKKKRQQRIALEDNRIFYVACTRAKRRLYLSATLKRDAHGDFVKPSKQSLLAKIWEKVVPTIETVTLADEHEPTSDQTIVRQSDLFSRDDFSENNQQWIYAIPDSWKFMPPSQTELSAEFDNSKFNAFADVSNENTIQAKAAGTVFHRVLKSTCEQRLLDLDRNDVNQFLPFWRAQLRQEGFDRLSATELAQRFASCLNEMRSDSVARWVLDNTHSQSKCEFALQGENLGANIIDRTFIDQGLRWVVDYKTSTPHEGQSTEDFIAKEIENYTPQLLQYREVIHTHDTHLPESERPKGFRAALYFPFLLQFVEITALRQNDI